MGDAEINSFDLQMETVMNRLKYTNAIQRLLDKKIKYKMKLLENQAANVDNEPLTIPEIHLSVIRGSKSEGLGKKMEEELIYNLNKQIHAMIVLTE